MKQIDQISKIFRTEFIMNVHTRWEDPQQDETCNRWAKDFFEATKPFATAGSYVNFVIEGDDFTESAYGMNTARLAELKAKYDHENRLRSNLSIRIKNRCNLSYVLEA